MATDLLLRLAEVSERQLLEALQRRASLAWPEDRAALVAHPDAIDLPVAQIADGRTWVAERAGRIVGFAVVLAPDDGDAELDGLFVEPAAWGSGIGRVLMAHAERVARDGGAPSLRVVANARAVGFYEACGFTRAGEERTRFGMAVVLSKTLPEQP